MSSSSITALAIEESIILRTSLKKLTDLFHFLPLPGSPQVCAARSRVQESVTHREATRGAERLLPLSFNKSSAR